jgi:hypothetical protein
MDSLVGLIQNAANDPVVEEASSSNALDEFLALELRFEEDNEGGIYAGIDDLKLLIEEEEEKAEADFTSSLDNFMDDILNVVKAIEENETETETEEASLLSLLGEPVGEWDEDRSVEL